MGNTSVFNKIGFIPKSINIVGVGSVTENTFANTMNNISSIGAVEDGVYPILPLEFAFYKEITVTSNQTYQTLFTHNVTWSTGISKFPPYNAIQVYLSARAISGAAIGINGRAGVYGIRSIIPYGTGVSSGTALYSSINKRTYIWTYNRVGITGGTGGEANFSLFSMTDTDQSIGLVPSTTGDVLTYSFVIKTNNVQNITGTWAVQGLATLL
jgi:hypothetical protein